MLKFLDEEALYKDVRSDGSMEGARSEGKKEAQRLKGKGYGVMQWTLKKGKRYIRRIYYWPGPRISEAEEERFMAAKGLALLDDSSADE